MRRFLSAVKSDMDIYYEDDESSGFDVDNVTNQLFDMLNCTNRIHLRDLLRSPKIGCLFIIWFFIKYSSIKARSEFLINHCDLYFKNSSSEIFFSG